MFFPSLKKISAQRRVLSQFGGLDLRNATPAGSFAAMENLTSREYPLLAARPRRGLVAETGYLGGMLQKDGLCYVQGTAFVINGDAVDMDLSPGEKQLVSMGAYVVIFPDKKYINTLDRADRGSLEASYTAQGTVQFSLCDAKGAAFENLATGPAAPEAPTGGQYWLDTSQSPSVLRCYSEAAGCWTAEAATCVRIAAQNIGADFAPGDGVKISGVAALALSSLNGWTVVQAAGQDYLVIPGSLTAPVTQDADQGAVKVERILPEMDYVIEAGNRLWGCRYGMDREGTPVNSLYACKLGDFKNWNCFQGLSTDSYAVSLGADGPFTGAVTHLGYPLFFRSGCLHKVYGSYPAAFQVQTTACRGVSQGSAKSLAIVNGVLYYLSDSGVCAYDGSLPEPVSQKLGYARFTGGVAGAWGSHYYISMTDAEGQASLFALDTEKNLWHREDHIQALCFCSRGESLFCHDGENIWDLAGTGTPEGQVTWSARTGHLDGAQPGHRYITRITARLSLEPGTGVQFWARYDGAGDWEQIGAVHFTGLGSVNIPMRTRRCESLELKICGVGAARLYSLGIVSGPGGDSL